MNLVENLHTHTFRCGHATGVDRDYVEGAIRAGVRVLGHAMMRFDGNRARSGSKNMSAAFWIFAASTPTISAF